MHDEGREKGYRGVRVLVCGATGFIGRWVARFLSREGARLWFVGRDSERLKLAAEDHPIQGVPIAADLSVPGSFEKVFSAVCPDITFNCAGYGVLRGETDEATSWRINADLVEEMAGVIVRRGASPWDGATFVHLGSGFEYGSTPDAITETSTADPRTLYGKSKLEGTRRLQRICSSTGLRAMTVRLFTVYGPGEAAYRLLPSLLRTARSNEPLQLTRGEQERDFTYVKDVAAGLLKLGRVPAVTGHVVNLATGSLTSVRDFAECARRILGLGPERIRYGALPTRPNEVRQGSVDLTLLRTSTGWTPSCTIEEGIRDTIAFETSRSLTR